jgi:hypothetical protein
MKDLPADRKTAIEAAVTDRRIQDVLSGIKTGSMPERIEAGKSFAALWKEGVEPAADGRMFQPFYILILDFAESTKDAALFEKSLGVLKKALADNPRAGPFFEKQDARLKALQAR